VGPTTGLDDTGKRKVLLIYTEYFLFQYEVGRKREREEATGKRMETTVNDKSWIEEGNLSADHKIWLKILMGWDVMRFIIVWLSTQYILQNKPMELFTLVLVNNCCMFRSTFGPSSGSFISTSYVIEI
jgi:hypothetical protein